MERALAGGTFTDGSRIAIVGAGPSGCLLAAAILDAARARRRVAQVTLFDGGVRLGRTTGPILIDPPALARLAVAGLPLPSGSCLPLGLARGVCGNATAETTLSAYSATRGDGSEDDIAAYLRAAAVSRGVRLVPAAVETIGESADGTFTLRASGRSERADLVVLACGAGAPLANALPGHVPPPVLRCCLASLDLDAGNGKQLAGRLIHILREFGPDLLLLPRQGKLHLTALGEDVTARDLAAAVADAVAAGHLPAPLSLGPVRRVLLPAGAARPGLPAIGSALGGSPGVSGLARAASQATSFAAALFDGGPTALLDACCHEALSIEGEAAIRARGRRRLARSPSATARAVSGESRRLSGAGPVTSALAALADPTLPAEALRRASRRVRTWLALLFMHLLLLLERLFLSPASTPASPRREVFVVDDDLDQASLLQQCLEERGLPTRIFTDGLSALAAAVRDRPAAMILDVALPWLDGPGVCQALRRSQVSLPVILVTALPMSLAAPEGERAGATAVLVKPLDLGALVARLSAFVEPGPRLHRPARTENPGVLGRHA